MSDAPEADYRPPTPKSQVPYYDIAGRGTKRSREEQELILINEKSTKQDYTVSSIPTQAQRKCLSVEQENAPPLMAPETPPEHEVDIRRADASEGFEALPSEIHVGVTLQ